MQEQTGLPEWTLQDVLEQPDGKQYSHHHDCVYGNRLEFFCKRAR